MAPSITSGPTDSPLPLFDTPIINQPQVAILGFGAVVKGAVVIAGSDGEDLLGALNTLA